MATGIKRNNIITMVLLLLLPICTTACVPQHYNLTPDIFYKSSKLIGRSELECRKIKTFCRECFGMYMHSPIIFSDASYIKCECVLEDTAKTSIIQIDISL